MKSSCNILGSSNKPSDEIKEWQPRVISFEDLEEDAEDETEEIILTKDQFFTVEKEKELSALLSGMLSAQSLMQEQVLIKDEENPEIAHWKPASFEIIETGAQPVQTVSAESVSMISDEIDEKQRELESLEAEIEAAQTEAEIIVQTARENAQRLMQETTNQVEQMKEDAYKEGVQKAESEAIDILKSATIYLDETRNWRKKILSESEKDVIELVQIVTKKLFGNGFLLKPEQVEQVVIRSITESNRLGQLRIYMNPGDHEKLVSLWQDSGLTVNGQRIQLVQSQDILQGGCFVEGEFGSVDSRIDLQLELIQEKLDATLNRSREDENGFS